MSWIRARFVGTCVGGRPREVGGARRFDFALHSGRVFDLESIPEPAAAACLDGEEGDVLGATPPGEYRQARVKRVCFPPSDDDPDPPERTLFDVRISDVRLKHPAEVRGRAYSTMEGTLCARLLPEMPELSPLQITRLPDDPAAASHVESDAPQRFRSRSPSTRFDASQHFARLRTGFALLALVVVSAALAIFCSLQTAAIWAVPVVVALGLGRLLRSLSFGTRALQVWLGVALIAGQGYWLIDPLQTAWRMGCRMPIREELIFIAVPVVLTALLRLYAPLVISSLLWTVVMCAWCGELEGTCRASAAPIRALGPATVGSRTDGDGRWPAMPGRELPRSAPPDLSGLLVVPTIPTNPTNPTSPTNPTNPTNPTIPTLPDPAASASSSAPSSLSDPAPAPPAAASQFSVIASQPSAAAATEGSFSTRSSVEGGWVSPDHRSAARELRLISVEHANRQPDEFFENAGTRRVYLPTDPIFDATGTRVSQAGALQLARLAALLSLHPERRAQVELHTDAGGSAHSQLQTSRLRAGAVREWLLGRGHLPAAQLEFVGVGASRPLVPPDGSYASQQPNRRIEVSLLD